MLSLLWWLSQISGKVVLLEAGTIVFSLIIEQLVGIGPKKVYFSYDLAKMFGSYLP